ncbi:hypothetical protein E2C01_007588 [Portunus trituberculatus]|uniref:Uncharacterized protein n=1 Tax=Portunus trituberculatus TaxID=210409 RepID=A0A5B7D4K0_PORTR|nr:hypothetical protein [Portunus trituberculatus]
MTRFHINSAYYLIQLQKLMLGIKLVKTLAINLLTSLDRS